jgi:hypothetical protein
MPLYDTHSNIRRILDALEGVKTSGDTGSQWAACCPAHEDREQSLSIGVGRDGKVLLHCHAGCTTPAVVEALGFTMAVLFPEKDDRRPGARPLRRKPAVPRPPPPPRPEKKPPDWAADLAGHRASPRCAAGLARFAGNLGLTAESLTAYGAVWKPVVISPPRADDPGELVWPERDAGGQVLGLGYRDPDGSKSQGAGGHRGLIYADGWRDRPGNIYLVEGLTDAAALWDLGLVGVGMPSNSPPAAVVEELVKLLGEVTGRRVVVLVENDRKPDGSHPGGKAKETAAKLAGVLKAAVYTAAVPDGAKDVRAWAIARKAEHGSSAGLGLFFVRDVNLCESSPAAGQPDTGKPSTARRDPAERCLFPRSLLLERIKDGQLQRWRPWCGTCSGCERRRKRELGERISKRLETTSQAGVPLYCTRIDPEDRSAAVRKLSRVRADGHLAEAYFVHTPAETLIVSTVPLKVGGEPVSLDAALGEVKDAMQAAVLRGKGKSIASVTKGWQPVKEEKEKLFRKLGTVKRPWEEIVTLCQSFGVEIETTLPTEGALLRRDVLHLPDGFAPELRQRLINELLSGPCLTEICTLPGENGGGRPLQGQDTGSEEWREDGRLWREREAFWNQVDAWWEDYCEQWKSTG